MWFFAVPLACLAALPLAAQERRTRAGDAMTGLAALSETVPGGALALPMVIAP